MYELALLLAPNAPINLITERLNSLGFIHTSILQSNCIIMLLYLKNEQLIEETLANLHIELPKYSKKSINCSTIEINKKKAEKYRHFIRIREFLDKKIKETEIYSKFKFKDRHKFLNDNKALEIDDYLREIAIYQIIATMKLDGNFMFVQLKSDNLLIDICPLRKFRHSSYNELKKIFIMKVDFLDRLVESIRYQMGEQTSFYFCFLLFLVKKMLYLVILGAITFTLDEYFHYDVTKSPFEPLYAALTVLWGAYFVAEWMSKQKEYQVKWRSEGKHYENFQQKLELSLLKCLKHKNHFEIQEKVRMIKYAENLDPVTGNKIQIKENLFKIYGYSIINSLQYLIALITFLIISLNVRGYVPEKNLLFISFMQIENNRDALVSYTLAILHVVIVSILNKKYKENSIATSLCEDHKSLETFERSLIVKRFSFEIFSAFFDFFFIGFVLDNIIRLKQEMVQMFMVDEIRRIFTETILPLISKLKLQQQQSQVVKSLPFEQKQQIMSHFSIEKQDIMEYTLKSQLISCFLPKYESFDDYLEIILNFGYVCFFTSAVRMAGIVVAGFLLLEFFSDYYKIHHLYQKSFSVKCNSIGPWTRAMDIICIISVFTNLMLFAVASDQIVKFFPSLFQDDSNPIGITQSQFDEIEDQQIKIQVQQCGLLAATPLPNKSGQMTFVVVVIEHVLLLLIYLIKKLFSLRQHWYDIYLKRKEYKKSLKE